jgi:hypothetical protein
LYSARADASPLLPVENVELVHSAPSQALLSLALLALSVLRRVQQERQAVLLATPHFVAQLRRAKRSPRPGGSAAPGTVLGRPESEAFQSTGGPFESTGGPSESTNKSLGKLVMIARVLAVAATVGASLPIASAFSPLSPSMGCGRAGSLQLRMGMRKDVSRRAALESVGKAAILIALAPMPALAAKGDYAKIDMRGTKSDSVSALGENDLPAAGKIDPYDNRDEANAQYGQRMQVRGPATGTTSCSTLSHTACG